MNKYQEAYEIIFDDLVPMPKLNERNRDWLFQCMDVIQQAVVKANKYDELTKTPTLEEVKKEWEEAGWSWFMDKICIKLTNKEDKEIEIHIWLKDIEYTKAYKEFYQYITFQEHNLLTKTFRALGWEV